MKKKLLVLVIAVASIVMPNLASAIAIDVGDFCWTPYVNWVVDGCASS